MNSEAVTASLAMSAAAGNVMAPPSEEHKLQPSTPSRQKPYKTKTRRNSMNSCHSCCISLKDFLHLGSPEAFPKTQKCMYDKSFMDLVGLLLAVISVVTFLVLARKLMQQPNCERASPAQCALSCPRHWVGYEGKCYYFSRDKRSWNVSQKYCSSYNASLARIDGGEKDFLMHLKSEDSYWIGLSRRESGQAWKWPNGENSTLEVVEGGNCVYIEGEAIAFSTGCHTELPWICSKPVCSN